MNNITKRFLLFLVGCIGARFFLVYLAKNINIENLPYMGYFAIIIAIGFMYLFITGSRKTGAEVLGGKIWWDKLRPIHAIMFAMFGYLSITKSSNAWLVLLIDVIFGLSSFLYFHYMEGDFSLLFQ